MEKKSKEQFTANQVVEILSLIYKDPKFVHRKTPQPKFSIEEFWFIRDLIFKKPKDNIIYHLANLVMQDRSYLKYIQGIHSGAALRLIPFYYYWVRFRGNATQAAIAAGYSPKTAKQAGHRALRRLQRYTVAGAI